MTERSKPQHERILLAKQLLDLGLRDADIAVKIQRDHSISRATSYRDLDTAKQEFDFENNVDHIEDKDPLSLEDRDSIMEMTRQLMLDAYQEKDTQNFVRLCKEYERLARMGGSASVSHQP